MQKHNQWYEDNFKETAKQKAESAVYKSCMHVSYKE